MGIFGRGSFQFQISLRLRVFAGTPAQVSVIYGFLQSRKDGKLEPLLRSEFVKLQAGIFTTPAIAAPGDNRNLPCAACPFRIMQIIVGCNHSKSRTLLRLTTGTTLVSRHGGDVRHALRHRKN